MEVLPAASSLLLVHELLAVEVLVEGSADGRVDAGVLPGPNNIERTIVDAHFVQSVGTKVNNNKCASALLKQNRGEGLQNTDR